MNNLITKAFSGFIFLFVILGLTVFIPAGTIYYWQAWAYLIIFFITTGAITGYLVKKDQALLQRRVNGGYAAEKEKKQKLIQFIAQFAFLGIFVFSAFDHRLKWSVVPTYASVAGDVLVIAGMLIVFLVFKENSFTSAIIEVGSDQKVITTGPYAFVRHPMYSGAFLMLIGTPVALGSWWGLLTFMPIAIVIIWRLLDEEKFLSVNLNGYTEYCSKVKSRLLPGIF